MKFSAPKSQTVISDRVLLRGLDGKAVLPSVPFGYVLALVVAGLGMGVMIGLYIGAVGSLLFFSFNQLYQHFLDVLLAGKPWSLGVLVGRSALCFVGLLAVAALCRPFLWKSREKSPLYALKERDQPLFFEFLRKICRATNSVFPTHVYVDCQGNAAAAVARGFQGLWSRDVALHIGLPLVRGLTARQFAGVVAHETGHFAQDSGMRISFLIRSLQAWLSRNVHDRDGWDEYLANKLERGGPVSLVFYRFIDLMFRAARGISWILWRIGQLLSSYLLRQMEYLSDGYESAVAGSSAFAETALKVSLMETSERIAQRNLQETFKNGRLPDDYPRYVEGIADRFSDEQLMRFEETLTNTSEHWADTHPAFTDRVQAVESQLQPGIYHVDEPAESLFHDFEALSHRVTLHYYRKRLKLTTDGLVLVPTVQLLQESFIDDVGLKMLFELLGESVAYLAPVFIPQQISPRDPPTRHLALLRPDLEKSVDAYVAAKDRLEELLLARAFAESDMKRPDAPDGGIVRRILARIGPAQFQSGESRRRAEMYLEELGRWFRERIDTLPPEFRVHAEELVSVLNAVSGASEDTHAAMREAVILFELVENVAMHSEYELILKKASVMSAQIQFLLQRALSKFVEVPYPYDHVKPDTTVYDYAFRPGSPGEAKIIQAFQAARHQGERLSSLYLRLLQDLVLITVQGNKPAA